MSGEEGWTVDRIALAQKLWTEGNSGAHIARQLGGVSRNAVLGKLWRLGQPPRVARISLKGGRPKSGRSSHVTNNGGYRTVRARLNSPGLKPAAAPKAPVDATFAKPWTERAFGQCAYPISGEGEATFSCCAPTDARYCKAHARIIYVPPKPPRTEAQAGGDLQRRLKAIKRFAARAA